MTGKPRETGTIALDPANPSPKYGDSILFTCIFEPKSLDKGKGGVRASCEAFDVDTGESLSVWTDHYDQPCSLGPMPPTSTSTWNARGGGPARCVARLFYHDYSGVTETIYLGEPFEFFVEA